MNANGFSFCVEMFVMSIAIFSLIMSSIRRSQKIRREEIEPGKIDWKDPWRFLSLTMLLIFLTVISMNLAQGGAIPSAFFGISCALVAAGLIVLSAFKAAKKKDGD